MSELTRIFIATWATLFVVVSIIGQCSFYLEPDLADRAWRELEALGLSLLVTVLVFALMGLWAWAGAL